MKTLLTYKDHTEFEGKEGDWYYFYLHGYLRIAELDDKGWLKTPEAHLKATSVPTATLDHLRSRNVSMELGDKTLYGKTNFYLKKEYVFRAWVHVKWNQGSHWYGWQNLNKLTLL